MTAESVGLVYKHNRYYLESRCITVLKILINDPIIHAARVKFEFSKPPETKIRDKDLNPEPPEDDDEDEENDDVISLEIQAEAVNEVKQQATKLLGNPLEEIYDYKTDHDTPNIVNIHLQQHTQIRSYQSQALSKMLGGEVGQAKSGIIVLPCGAGKTLTGIIAAHTIKKSVICLTPNTMSARQWKQQFLLWTTCPEQDIMVFTSDEKQQYTHSAISSLLNDNKACILITTYQMLAFNGRRATETQYIMDMMQTKEWGLMLLDEVHVVPAREYRRAVCALNTKCKLGLTATMVREDDKIDELIHIVGPILYEANWKVLTHQGYLANVRCIEAWCPLTESFQNAYHSYGNNNSFEATTAAANNSNTARKKMLLCGINPNKLRMVELLVRYHERKGDKIIIFSDYVFVLETCAKMLQRPYIYGETREWERQLILDVFRQDNCDIQTICLSKVGDVAIDLPKANVVIQVSCQFTSRRAEAQRLGRILRPKSSVSEGNSSTQSASTSFDAFFYTLVCTDTQEMKFCKERQQYLVEQGYKFEIVKDLWKQANDLAVQEGYTYSTPRDDHMLLEAAIKETQRGTVV